MAIATGSAPASPTGLSGPAAASAGSPAGFGAGALRLLACGACAVLVVCLAILPNGPSESAEGGSWILVVAVAIPGGLFIAGRQARLLSSAAPAALVRGLAAGLALLALAFLLRRVGTGDRLHHALLAGAAIWALAAPFLAARTWRKPTDEGAEVATVVALLSTVFMVLLFVPRAALEPETLAPAIGLTAAALALARLIGPRRLSRRASRLVDVGLCCLLALVVIQLPDIAGYAGNVIHHHNFFLGPANDVLHGGAMLGDTWSQYGVGALDALGLAFMAIPIGFGTFALIVVALTVGLYLCVYAILRLAGLGQALAVVVLGVAALGNLFSPLETYLAFPSDSPLRFGLPYLVILCGVFAARYPGRARPAWHLILALLAISATWSLEVFAYCGATYGALILVEALAAGPGVVKRVLRGAAVGLCVSAAAVLLLSLATLLLSGELDWGPYLEYLRLYSVEELGQVPVVFFSAGPLMAAAIFSSAAILLWLVRDAPWVLAAPMRSALAGVTALAIVSFTYYLGRSHPNNLLVLLIPPVVLGGLWLQVLLEAQASWWRTAIGVPIALSMALIAVAAWPSVEVKAPATALGLAAPGGDSPWGAAKRLAGNPPLDPRAPAGAAVLAEHLPPGEPALVLTEPDLTTEILVRAGRRNLLPISHLPEDALIESGRDRVRAASEEVPAGTLLLTSVPTVAESIAGPPHRLKAEVLDVLHRRFAFRLLERTPEGLELVRLVEG